MCFQRKFKPKTYFHVFEISSPALTRSVYLCPLSPVTPTLLCKGKGKGNVQVTRHYDWNKCWSRKCVCEEDICKFKMYIFAILYQWSVSTLIYLFFYWFYLFLCFIYLLPINIYLNYFISFLMVRTRWEVPMKAQCITRLSNLLMFKNMVFVSLFKLEVRMKNKKH